MACGPVCPHARPSAPVLFPDDGHFDAPHPMGLLLEIPRRTELARSGRFSGLAKGLLGHPVEKGRKLRGKVAICGRKSGSGGPGHKVKRLAISRRNAFFELVILGGRCSVGAHFSRAPAWPCQADGGGAAPRESRTTRRSSLQFYHERGAEAPLETLGGRCSVGAHFSRAPARHYRPEWGRGCAPQMSDDTAVVPPVYQRTRRGERPSKTLEGDAMKYPSGI